MGVCIFDINCWWNPFQVKQKVEDIRGMLAGTKTSVDHLMPKSEELLSQSQRQERAISNIHNDLTEKTNAIINELSQVKNYKRIYIPKQNWCA